MTITMDKERIEKTIEALRFYSTYISESLDNAFDDEDYAKAKADIRMLDDIAYCLYQMNK